MANRKQIEFAKKVFLAAKESKKGFSPIFTTAQACLETGWGSRTVGKFNIFGITKGSWTGKTVLILTKEYFRIPNKKFVEPEKVISVSKLSPVKYKYTVMRLFREYNSLTEALEDHEKIFEKSMYSDAYQYRSNPLVFASKICDAHGARYATSPYYYNTLRKIIIQITNLSKNW
jgi:flagellum-specific peptidoglycan hydrolase FlgJ